ncbi:SusC/RagA family TonB-linked outer membrane protein [Chitinophaga sp. RAB17]|uniref:SusC/RagA family TonB-linked outer membrane protein n=1 Tax=Chitinophaga sp. RAB17 TaxID=3233049 RepID=UPI003F8E7026
MHRFTRFLILLLALAGAAHAQNKTITGTVKDKSTGAPIPGVTILLKGTTKGTVTQPDGSYALQAPVSAGSILIFRAVGYDEIAQAAGTSGVLNISMASGSSSLSEIIVVGYGTQKKANLTGAVSAITGKELKDRPVTNVASALQGTMPGVTVTQTSGQPGKDAGSIRIRGIGTLNNKNPMVVVDGIVMSTNDDNASAMTNVDPNDIESISVLKDAASAAIYGSRAANGVVIITTKKGKAGTIRVHYNGYFGKQKPTHLPDYLPSWQAASLFNEVQKNEGRPVRYTDAEIEKFKNGSDPDNYPNTDWQGLVFSGTGNQQNHYLDFSGGSDKTQYLFSLGYLAQDGIIKNSGLKRYNTRLNLNSKINDRLSVFANISYSLSDMREPTNPYTGDFSQVIRQANRIGANVPYKTSNGYYGYINDGNPMAWLESGAQYKEFRHRLLGITGVDLEIARGLHFKPTLGYTMDLTQSKKFIKDIQYYDAKTGNPTLYQGPNSLTDFNDNYNVITLQALLDYEKTIKDHHFKILGGYSHEYTKYSFLQGYRKNFLNNQLSELNAGPADGQQATGSAYEVALQSFFGRINYDYKGKYMLEANLRYDGTSRFASQNRWGLYPSFSAGWNISEEAFFEEARHIVPQLKLRGSWGQLGNQDIGGVKKNDIKLGNYPYIPVISAGQNYTFGNSIAGGISPVMGANPDIRWESLQSTNLGIDAGFLDNRISLSVDYFIKDTRDILLNVPVGGTYGFIAPVQNAGTMRNKGWEVAAGYHEKKGDFSYSITANAAFIKNEITDLDGTDPIITGATYLKVGHPANSYYGYQAEGIFQTQEEVDKHAKQTGGKIAPGDLKYKDQNGDGVIDGNDRVYLGSYFPKVTYGVNLGGGWKGFDVSVFLQGAAGVKGFIQGALLGTAGDKIGRPTSALLDRWTPEHPTDKFPRLWNTYTQNDASTNPSSFWVRDASYLRLKNLQVGYTFPTTWLKRAGIQGARVYYSGQNILTFTNFYSWVDPEATNSASGYDYPQVKVNTVGINLTF